MVQGPPAETELYEYSITQRHWEHSYMCKPLGERAYAGPSAMPLGNDCLLGHRHSHNCCLTWWTPSECRILSECWGRRNNLQKECDDRKVNIIPKSAGEIVLVLSPHVIPLAAIIILQRQFICSVISASPHVTVFAVKHAFIPVLHCWFQLIMKTSGMFIIG